MKHQFKYYLHENAEGSELVEVLLDRGLDEELAERIAYWNPFYKVKFDCEWDDIHKILTAQAYFQERLTNA